MFVCWKVVFFLKVNPGKVNYFPMFGSVMKNKLENNFQYLVVSLKMSWMKLKNKYSKQNIYSNQKFED
jgi:hypothetical protein